MKNSAQRLKPTVFNRPIKNYYIIIKQMITANDNNNTGSSLSNINVQNVSVNANNKDNVVCDKLIKWNLGNYIEIFASKCNFLYLYLLSFILDVIVLGVVKRNPLFFHSILCKNNRFLFTTPNTIYIVKIIFSHLLFIFFLNILYKNQ